MTPERPTGRKRSARQGTWLRHVRVLEGGAREKRQEDRHREAKFSRRILRRSSSAGPSPQDVPLRALIVERESEAADLLLGALRRAGLVAVVHGAASEIELVEQLRCAQDVVLVDDERPAIEPSRVLDLLRAQRLDVPLIVFGEGVGERRAIAHLRRGAADCIAGSGLALFGPMVSRAQAHQQARAAVSPSTVRALRPGDDLLGRAERSYRAVVDSSLDLVAILGNDGIIRYANPAHQRCLGHRSEDLVGRPALDLVHPDDLPEFALSIERSAILASGEQLQEFRYQHRDGSWRAMEGAVRSLAGDGAPAGMIVTARDVTARKQDDERRREEAQVATILASVGRELIASLVTRDLLERLCRVSAGALGCESCATLVYRPASDAYVVASTSDLGQPPAGPAPRSELPRERLGELLERLDREDVVELDGRSWNTVIDGEGTHGASGVALCMALRRGREIAGLQVAWRASPTTSFGPRERRIACGIAQLASMALENARLIDAAEKASRVKSEFVATMSHELRTPLHVIIGFTSLVLEGAFGELNDEQADALRRVGRSSGELLELVNQILDLGRLEREEMALEATETRLAELIGDLASEATLLLERKPSLTLEWEVEPGASLLRTDPGKLKVLLRNLIGNAVKFTSAGVVLIRARPVAQDVEIAVSDTGIGISPEALAVIFDPFRQADGSMTREHGGAGLGLYVVRRLVDRLGGQIEIESEPGRGSIFRVRLSACRPAMAGSTGAPSTAGVEHSSSA